jgi:hypothetical protein
LPGFAQRGAEKEKTAFTRDDFHCFVQLAAEKEKTVAALASRIKHGGAVTHRF